MSITRSCIIGVASAISLVGIEFTALPIGHDMRAYPVCKVSIQVLPIVQFLLSDRLFLEAASMTAPMAAIKHHSIPFVPASIAGLPDWNWAHVTSISLSLCVLTEAV